MYKQPMNNMNMRSDIVKTLFTTAVLPPQAILLAVHAVLQVPINIADWELQHWRTLYGYSKTFDVTHAQYYNNWYVTGTIDSTQQVLFWETLVSKYIS